MKNLALCLLLVAALVFGAKTYLEYRYSRLLDQQSVLLSSDAAISNQDVVIDWDGSLLVKDLRVRPIKTELTLHAMQLRLSSSLPFKTLVDIRALENGNFNQVFDVAVSKITIDGASLSTVDASKDCRNLASMFVFPAIDMVPLRPTANFKVDARDVDTVAIRYDSLDQLGNYRGRFVVDKDNLRDVMSSRAGLKLNKLSLTAQFSRDKADQLMQYCSQLFRVGKEDYINKVLASPKFSSDSFGVDLGEQARFALASFMRGESEIAARFSRFGDINNLVTDLSEQSIWRGLELDIDDVAIPLDVPDVATAEIEIAIAEIQELVEKTTPKKQYIARDIEDAINYVGRRVRIERTNDRKPIQGRLVAETLDSLLVKVLHPKGEVTLTVKIADTESFSVRQK